MDPDQEVDVVPPAEVKVIELLDFLPLRCIIPVWADGESCACGLWQFYSAVCGHLFQTFDARCGATKN